MNISWVVVNADRHIGPVPEELDPVDQQLEGDEVEHPGGLTFIGPHQGCDVGQTCSYVCYNYRN